LQEKENRAQEAGVGGKMVARSKRGGAAGRGSRFNRRSAKRDVVRYCRTCTSL